MPIAQPRIVFSAALALALNACAAGPEKPAAAPATPPPANLTQTLEAHRWTLVSATDGQARRIDAVAASAERPIVFTFAGARLSVQGGCNRMMGGFQVDAQGLLNVSRLAGTQMACEGPAMQADAALSALLAKPLKVELGKGPQPSLRLSASDGMLLLSGQLTPEARYGPGETIFMEVGAQQVACNHPLVKGAMCLQVRERRYDAQGLPVGTPGAWQPLVGAVEGFTHTPGVRNVLRVKRYARNPAPADSSAYVYVLDLVVESETVSK